MIDSYKLLKILFYFQDCAGVILYTAEAATQMALDAIQILGKAIENNMSACC